VRIRRPIPEARVPSRGRKSRQALPRIDIADVTAEVIAGDIALNWVIVGATRPGIATATDADARWEGGLELRRRETALAAEAG
jgi:hypothetical protein